MSWDDELPGARASRPHKAWDSLGYFSHVDQPGTAPLLPFRLADAVPADTVAACRIALKPSGRQAAKLLAAFSIDSQVVGKRHLWAVMRTLVEHPVHGGLERSAREGRGRALWRGQDAGGTPALPGDAGRQVTSQRSDVHPPPRH